MSVPASMQAAIAAHRFGARRTRPRHRRRRSARLADGPDRSGRRAARRWAARHPASARARRRRTRPAAAGEEPARRHDGGADHRQPLPRGDRRRCPLAPGHRGGHAPSVRRAPAVVLDQPLHRLAAEGQHPRPGRRLRARRDPAAHRRPLRDPAGRLDDAPGDAPLSRQLALGRPALSRRRAGSSPGRPQRPGSARQRPQREPRPRGAGAAHARRRGRPRRRPTPRPT